jgi:hypothetical protein
MDPEDRLNQVDQPTVLRERGAAHVLVRGDDTRGDEVRGPRPYGRAWARSGRRRCGRIWGCGGW